MSSCASGELLARGDAQLEFDQVDPGDQLSDRVLDLKPGVHLHEEELVRVRRGHNEFDGACTDVVDAAGGVTSGGADTGAGGLVQQRGWRFLDDLLMAALQAALPLTEVNDVAVAIGKHLDFDVPGHQNEPLQEQRVVAEGRRRFAARGGERCR